MKNDIVERFFSGTGSTYDLIVNLFTYGADRYWKKKILDKIPSSEKILDLACGTGILTFKLANKYPNSKIVGVDRMKEYIVLAQRKKEKLNTKNVQFVCARAENMLLQETFDSITSSYIPKYVAADELLKNVSSFLKQDGSLILHDFAYPTNFIFKKTWEMHMLFMKYTGTLIFPKWRTIFYELAHLVRSTQWITEYVEALRRFNYEQIEVNRLTAGSAAIISAKKSRE
jgi:demethylmenaquinone methyltransferase/2-methoxy-6-polyprenyl-1,4-benzoquinol methylase